MDKLLTILIPYNLITANLRFANLYSQVEFLDNWFHRHPLKNSNSLFSFEFCLATIFTNLFFFFFVPIILRSDSLVGLRRLGPIYMKVGGTPGR